MLTPCSCSHLVTTPDVCFGSLSCRKLLRCASYAMLCYAMHMCRYLMLEIRDARHPPCWHISASLRSMRIAVVACFAFILSRTHGRSGYQFDWIRLIRS